MFMPRLKPLTCHAGDGRLVASLDPRSRIELADPAGQVLALFELLAEGRCTPHQLRAALAERWADVTQAEVDDALRMLDGLGWLENAAARPLLTDPQRERYFSNLAFFDAFTSITRTREEIQQALLRAHVLVLGAGGLGSCVLQNLAGLGVGRLTLVDQDVVEVRILARQFTYTEAQVGRPKVEQVGAWLREFNSATAVTAHHVRVTGPESITPLLAGVDLVVCAIDEPPDVDRWVNETCVGVGRPVVVGGLTFTQGVYCSVDPGRSACWECLITHRSRSGDGTGELTRIMRASPVNRGIGPVTTMLGSLVAMEALRYLTGITPPAAAGMYRVVDFAGDGSISSDPWPADPGCPVCANARRAQSSSSAAA
jgi:molybdopterin/thiamine biosynthesis adenylyltransferase